MSWFGKTFGFEEFDGTTGVMKGANAARIRANFEYDPSEGTLVSKANGRSFYCGEFCIPSLSDLCEILSSLEAAEDGEKEDGETTTNATFENITGDVRSLMLNPANAGAIFQAASQFNCLEMINPGVSPEDGITNYLMDRTQGPICAMACPSATLIRNYFASFPVEGLEGPGQSSNDQIDTTKDVHSILCAELPKGKGLPRRIWKQSNGYMLAANETSISGIGKILEANEEDSALKEACRQALRIGVHWNTETQAGHSIAQVFCSACPVAYDRTTDVYACKDEVTNKVPSKREIWAPLATLILQSAYESTFLTAAILALRGKTRKTLYLTKLGGGVFGNSDAWIAAAIQRCLTKYRHLPIDVKVVHYGSPGSGTNRYASVGL